MSKMNTYIIKYTRVSELLEESFHESDYPDEAIDWYPDTTEAA